MNEVIQLISEIPTVNEIILVDSEEILFNHGAKLSFRVPRGSDNDYSDIIYSIVKQQDIHFIFVCSDEEALSLSLNDWSRKISHLDSYDNISLVLDKFKLHTTLAQVEGGAEMVPDFMKFTSVSQLEKAIEKHGSLILRPIHGRGSRGLVHLVSKELKQMYGQGVVLQDFTIPDDKENYFLTSYLTGDKFSADCVFDNGEILSCMIRNNGSLVKYKPPTMIAETSVDYDVYEFAQKVGKSLLLNGFHQIECGKDIYGKVKLIEINPRLDATLPITVCYADNFYQLILTREKKGLLQPVKKIFKRFFITNTK
jgi:predicted ATP-grasp superfamily ATP-dependent carboligase